MSVPLHLVILAGGRGERARRPDDARPKQFVQVAGRPLFAWSVARLASHPDVASLALTCPEEFAATSAVELEAAAPGVPHVLAAPGATRTASTLSALEALAVAQRPGAEDLVAVHDAARPLVCEDLLARLAAAALRAGGAVPGTPVTDTTVRLGADGRLEYLSRRDLRGVQTPQVFRWAPFLAAHRRAAAAGQTFTDDGGLMAAAGRAPALVEGDAGNFKVTTSEDLAAVTARLALS